MSVTFKAVVALPENLNRDTIYRPLWSHNACGGDIMTLDGDGWQLTPYAGRRSPVGPSIPVDVGPALHAHLLRLNEKQGLATRMIPHRHTRSRPTYLRLES